MRTIFITGVNGFVGHHLVREIKKSDLRVVGIGRESSISPDIASLVDEYYSCNLSISSEVEGLPIESANLIVHLAGLAAAGPSFEQPNEYINVNSGMLVNLAQVALKLNSETRFLVVSSGAIYSSNQAMPLTETSKILFSSPYVVSKVTMENLCEYYRLRGLSMLVLRPFNHIGPGQKEGFIVPDLYRKMMTSLKTEQPLVVGNLKTHRDYTDVRDVVRAYVQLALAEASTLTSPIYNVCSGVTRSGEEILAELKKHIPGSEKLELTTDPKLIRANDPQELIGSNELLKSDAGWKPQIPFEQTIADFVAWQQKN